jgi:hypothetical protein
MLELGIWPLATASRRVWRFEPLLLAITKMRHDPAMVVNAARRFLGVVEREGGIDLKTLSGEEILEEEEKDLHVVDPTMALILRYHMDQ